jgi:type II secretory pathway pseudopilin PulG
MKKIIPAFSLLELSFVLMIAGILLSFSLPLLLSATNYEKKNLTHYRLQEISKALKAYALAHGNLPFPSKSITTDISFGEANLSCSQGVVPFKTLGLHPLHNLCPKCISIEWR